MSAPNMVTESGREDLPLDDRYGLLEANVVEMERNYAAWDDGTVAGNHRMMVFLNGAKHTKEEVSKRFASGVANPTAWLSQVECEVMAWRRGGEAEWKRVRSLYYRVIRDRREEAAVEQLRAKNCMLTSGPTSEGQRTGWWDPTKGWLAATPSIALRLLTGAEV